MSVANWHEEANKNNDIRPDGDNLDLSRKDVSVKTLAASGNATVGGTLAVTGDLSSAAGSFSGEIAGTTGAFTGAVTVAGLTSTSPSAAFGYNTGAGGAVTQLTDATTAVTLNTKCGQITTVALTTAAAADEEFTLTNSRIGATDCVVLSTTYTGAGTPMLSVKGVAAGSCKIVITNVHAANALNALMVINFAVIDVVAA